VVVVCVFVPDCEPVAVLVEVPVDVPERLCVFVDVCVLVFVSVLVAVCVPVMVAVLVPVWVLIPSVQLVVGMEHEPGSCGQSSDVLQAVTPSF